MIERTIETTIAGRDYRIERLNAIQQFHVSRKIAPLVPTVIPVFLKVSKMKGGLQDNLAAVAEVLQPFADGIASLPDASVEYLLDTCLASVKRKKDENWTPVWSSSAKALMFDDMDLGSLMPIVVRVIQENLGPFIEGLLTSQQATSEPSAAK